MVVVIFAHVSSLSDEDNAREDANLFCRLLLFLGIVVIDTDDVNDEEGLRPLKPRGIALSAILFARAPLKTDDDAFGVLVEVKIVLLLKVVIGDDVFCDVFRIIIIASAAWVRAALFVANNTPRRRIPKEDILLFFLCVKKRSLSKVSRHQAEKCVQSAVFLSAFTLKFYEKRRDF